MNTTRDKADWNVRVINQGCSLVREYLDGERQAAGAQMGYAHLEPRDELDPSENLKVFEYTCTHAPSGKTWTKRTAFFDGVDFANYLALWNAANPETWQYAEVR